MMTLASSVSEVSSLLMTIESFMMVMGLSYRPLDYVYSPKNIFLLVQTRQTKSTKFAIATFNLVASIFRNNFKALDNLKKRENMS
jgi:hypothetical protein